ncbi:hypothetical protein [Photobacterium nomapromontoriensis]|uniref:hypothetical protein n=1 Tax=Photobacterium nomapromontoriensis TaxID=2910237 RepID=UPI003D11E21E
MVKSLCKFRRVELADQFSAISRIVSEPNYICSSCARVAAEKGYLCKPSALARPPVAEATTAVLTRGISHQAPLLAPVMSPENASSPMKSKRLAKQLKAVKKLAKKKKKQFKKAAKALKHYDKALRKAKTALQLS